MAYSATTVANAFISLAKADGLNLTNMKLQKLVYIANGFYLGKYNKPLFDEVVRAWQWGPVIPELYEKLRAYGAGEVRDYITPEREISEAQDPEAMEIIHSVWKGYEGFSSYQLSAITHKIGSPWRKAWGERHFSDIDNDLIARYYSHLLDEQEATAQPA